MRNNKIRYLCCFTIFAVLAASNAWAEKTPFDDAVAVWHMANCNDAVGQNSNLKPEGKVQVGIELKGDEYTASLKRGGDGHVACFQNGYLSAGQGADGELNLKGRKMTMCVRLRDPSGKWDTPLFSKHGGHDKLVYNLFATNLDSKMALGFEMGTTKNSSLLRTSILVSQIDPKAWHDVVCRSDGAKLEMFIDGRCVDEDFLLGDLREGNIEPCLIGAESYGGKVKTGFDGLVDHVALWDRALSNDEILALSGGKEEADLRVRTDRGDPNESMQYWIPPNHYFVGDCLPFFCDGTFHFVYLLDRKHHSSKNGLGAHQWAQATSTDLIHWKQQPMVVPITDQWEGSICTGSLFHHDGIYYAFYATRASGIRFPGWTGHLAYAISRDGIHFEKQDPNPMFTMPACYNPRECRDPVVFQDPDTGLFHMLVTSWYIKDTKFPCLAHFVSSDLKSWKPGEPIKTDEPGTPECPDWFEWNGWYYLNYSPDGVARYRVSKQPLGPWEKPEVDIYGSLYERVAKTAAFKDNRRLSVSWCPIGGYAGCAVFRELVQFEDGSLGTKFVPEMIPASGDPLTLSMKQLTQKVSGTQKQVKLDATSGFEVAAFENVPQNVRITLDIKPEPGVNYFGLCLRGSGNYEKGCELRFDPAKKQVQLGEPKDGHMGDDSPTCIRGVKGIDQSFKLDIILKRDIVDVCVDNRRTLIRQKHYTGDRLFLFAKNGKVTFENVTVRPLSK